MKKNIDTLIEDIYSLFDLTKKTKLNEKEIIKILNDFGKEMKEHLSEYLFREPTGTSNLRLSSIGRPDRQIWYDLKEQNKEKLFSPPVRIKFLYGHILETLLLTLSKLAGHKVTEEQKEVTIAGVTGHQDCRIDDFLVDCKSASTASFKKFENGTLKEQDPFGYIGQLSAYAEAHGDKEAGFFVIDKQNGYLTLLKVHEMEMINAEDRVKYLKKIIKKNDPPSKCYTDVPDGSSGNYKLAIGCVYCSHKTKCWSDSNQGHGLRAFRYAKGVRFLTKVQRVPEVPEVTNVSI
jgi:hypothetical protein